MYLSYHSKVACHEHVHRWNVDNVYWMELKESNELYVALDWFLTIILKPCNGLEFDNNGS